MHFDRKVIVVTGGTRGIGRAIAARFLDERAHVAVIGRSLNNLQRITAELPTYNGRLLALQADISNEEDVCSIAAKVEKSLGPVDILVNNAAIFSLYSIVDTTLEEWESVMATNVRGVFLCCRAFLPMMMQRRSGRIINISSTAGHRGYLEQGAYCASKHAVNGFSKVLALECQPYGIRVHVISPGGVLTDLSAGLRASRGCADESEWMTPEEVANAVFFVASQEGAATTDELCLRRYASEPWR